MTTQNAAPEPAFQKNPSLIEDASFRIIDEEIGAHSFAPAEYQLIRRVIHASADFDFKETLVISTGAIASGVEAVKAGAMIVCDVQMVEAGISKPLMKKFGCSHCCFVSDPDVIREAEAEGVTRSIIAMRRAIERAPNGIFAIGNAPTALLELIRLVKEEGARPALIIGVPVGFVSAAESKERLCEVTEVPFIAARGRKGGSPIAVAAINAIMHLANQTYEQGLNPFVRF